MWNLRRAAYLEEVAPWCPHDLMVSDDRNQDEESNGKTYDSEMKKERKWHDVAEERFFEEQGIVCQDSSQE